MTKLPEINLQGVQTKAGLPMPSLWNAKKRIWFLTYTLTQDAIDELEYWSRRGIDVRGMVGKNLGHTTLFGIKENAKCHAKVWIIDDRVFVGSCNLAGDTLFNVMVEVQPEKQRKQIIAFTDKLIKGYPFSPMNIVV